MLGRFLFSEVAFYLFTLLVGEADRLSYLLRRPRQCFFLHPFLFIEYLKPFERDP